MQYSSGKYVGITIIIIIITDAAAHIPFKDQNADFTQVGLTYRTYIISVKFHGSYTKVRERYNNASFFF